MIRVVGSVSAYAAATSSYGCRRRNLWHRYCSSGLDEPGKENGWCDDSDMVAGGPSSRPRARRDSGTGTAGGPARGVASCRPRAGEGGEDEDRPRLRAEGRRKVARPRRDAAAQGRTALSPVLRQRLCRRRLYAWRRLPAIRQPVQHGRRARQPHVLRLQARRGRVPRAASVQPARCPVGDRRLARSHASRLLRDWDDPDVERGSRELQLHAAVRRGKDRSVAHAEVVCARRRSRVLAMGSGAGKRNGAVRRRGLHA